MTDRLNQTLDYQFGPTGRLALATFKLANSSVESSYKVDYDPNTDLLSQVTDRNSTGGTIRTFAFLYDNIDRLKSETRAESGSTWVNGYTYDDLDRRLTYAATGQSPVSYGYDPTDNITSISQVQNGTNRVFTFQFDALGRMTQRLLPNGVSTNWTFNDAGFLYKVDSQRYGVSFDTHNYSEMDGLGQTLVGQIQTETVRRDMGTSGIQNVTNSFQYDDLYRLMGATVEGTSSEWEYDNVGNRMSQTVGGTTNSYLYDDANRLSSVDGVTVTHDANGNLTAYNGNTYTWDVRGRLTAMTAPGLSASFDYDFQDRRADKQINSTPRTFRWDGDDLVNDTSGTHTRWTLQSPILDEPLAQYDSYFPDGLYITPNHLGSSTTLTDLNGWPQNWYFYQPFGQTSQSNSNFDNWGRFRFTGREADETGLYYYRARYYSPDLGRFISEDPAGPDGFGNQYAYTGNGPIRAVDPFGLTDTEVTIDPKTGLGVGFVYADKGDFVPPVPALETLDITGYSAQGDELIVGPFNVSNRPARGHTPFPVGTFNITGIHAPPNELSEGPGFIYIGQYGQEPRDKGKGMHGTGIRPSWKHRTKGCLRCEDSVLSYILELLELNGVPVSSRPVYRANTGNTITVQRGTLGQ